MNIEEFGKRTAKFLTKEEVADYESDYEPAYMAAEGIGKDDFCAMLKDTMTRAFVKSVSRALLAKDELVGQFHREWKSALEERDEEAMRKVAALKAIEAVSAMCDRAMTASAGKWPQKRDGR